MSVDVGYSTEVENGTITMTPDDNGDGVRLQFVATDRPKSTHVVTVHYDGHQFARAEMVAVSDVQAAYMLGETVSAMGCPIQPMMEGIDDLGKLVVEVTSI